MEKEIKKSYLVMMPPSLHDVAKERATTKKVSFGAYVRSLIIADTK